MDHLPFTVHISRHIHAKQKQHYQLKRRNSFKLHINIALFSP